MSMGEKLLELVEAGHRLLLMKPDRAAGLADFVLLAPERLPDFGLAVPVALTLCDVGTLDENLLAAGFKRDGVYGVKDVQSVTRLGYFNAVRWLLGGLIYAPGGPPGSGRAPGWKLGYISLLSAALAYALRETGGAPAPVLRLLSAFFAAPVAWEPEKGADPKAPRKEARVHA
jgi:hypothetical protein